MTKALVLLSGGLDSMLAAKVLKEQGIDVTGVSFKSCFFGTAKAKKAAEKLGIELLEMDFSDEHLAMVKNPHYGYGKHMNPCIDCHSLMVRKAGEIALQKKFDFIATGEVLGQRPMSQNKDALKQVEKHSGVGDRLLRPLCAKLLEETPMEKNGLVLRDKLYDISGRTRSRQEELAKKFGFTDYPTPGGGCLLTEEGFSEKLKEMFARWPNCNANYVLLLKNGRHFWFTNEKNESVLLVVGRDKEDCENLLKMAKTGDVVVELKNETGPIGLTRGLKKDVYELDVLTEISVPEKIDIKKIDFFNLSDGKILEQARLLVAYYAVKARGKKVKIEVVEK